MGWEDRAYNRDDNGGVPPVVFSFPKLTPLTLSLIVVNLAMFIVQVATNHSIVSYGRLTYADGTALFQPWRFVTYQYLHANAYHIFFNLLGVYFFMPALEMFWGWRKALAFYTLGGIFAGLTYGVMLLFLPRGYQVGGLIGASGSVFASLGAVALLSPNRQLILIVFPVPIRVAAALFGGLYLLSAIGDRNLSDAAHLGGLVFGFFAPYLAGPVLIRWRHKWERSRSTKLATAQQAEELAIDRILEKVHQQGMNSLSRRERATLKNATERQRVTGQQRRGRGV